MKSYLLLLLALAVAPVCHGADRFYVDPAYSTTRYEDLATPAKPLLLKLSVSGTDAMSMVFGESRLRDHVVQVLRQSGLIRSSYAAEDGTCTVTLKDLMKKGSYDRSGPGRRVRWVYELVVVISTGGRTATRGYEHAILLYEGKSKEAEGLTEPIGLLEAWDTIVEQMLLRALRDFQQEGVIPKGVGQEPPVNWTEAAPSGAAVAGKRA